MARILRELMTIPVGQSVSNHIDLGNEELRGVYIIQLGGGAPGDLRLQNLVSGQPGGSGDDAPVWIDIFITATTDPPTPTNSGYSSDRLKLSNPEAVASGVLIFFRKDVASGLLPIIRVAHDAAPTGTPTTVRLVTDSIP